MRAGDGKAVRATVLERIIAWWQTWEAVLDGADDLHEGYRTDLEDRVARLEQDVASLRAGLQRPD